MSPTRASVLILTLFTAASAQAASMRCEHGIIETGAQLADVLAQCGAPADHQHTPQHIDPDGYPAEGSVTEDHLTYGPDNGMTRRLRFIDGRLVEIDSARR